MKRELDIVVISNIFLGKSNCHTKELLNYLGRIQPKKLILNGNLITSNAFNKKSFPKNQLAILDQIIRLSISGTSVYYVTNDFQYPHHKFSSPPSSSINLRKQLVLQLQNKKYWIYPFSDDYQKGNDFVNKIKRFLTRGTKNVSANPKDEFEIVQSITLPVVTQQEYDYVIFGHPSLNTQKKITIENRVITYLNAGDWNENLSTLEFNFGKWSQYQYDEMDYFTPSPLLKIKAAKPKASKTTQEIGLILEQFTPRSSR